MSFGFMICSCRGIHDSGLSGIWALCLRAARVSSSWVRVEFAGLGVLD